MMQSSARFAEILTTAVITIKALTGRNLEAIQDELGYELGRDGGSFIHYLCKGHLPADVEDALALLDCERFLESAGVPRPKEAAYNLWAVIEGEHAQLC